VTHLPIVGWIFLAAALALSTALVVLELRAQKRHFSLRGARNRELHGVADELVWGTQIRPDLIKNVNGAYMRMWEIVLPRKEELDEHAVADSDVGLAKAMALFAGDCVTHLHDAHMMFNEYDRPADYSHPILNLLDEARETWFRTPGRVYASRYIYSVAWMPPNARDFADRMKRGGAPAIATENEQIAEFDRRCDDFETFLAAYGKVVRQTVVDGRSQMLSHLAWCFSGRERDVIDPYPGTQIAGMLAEQIERSGSFKVGELHTRVIVVTALPDQTYPLYLSRLRELRAPYALSIRFLPDDGDRARKLMHDALTDWTSKSNESTSYVDAHAIDMVESARQAVAAIAQGVVRFGRASVSVIVRHPTEKGVEKLATRARSLLDEINLPAYIARGRTQEEDFFASLPGDGYRGIRKFPIHALNVAHFASAHGESNGRKWNGATNVPAKTAAIMYATTPEKSQVRLHLSDSELPQVQHFLAIGGTGRGKSVFLGALVASYMARYPGAGFTGVDRGRSLYRLTRFLDGNFYDFLGPSSPGFALFAHVDRPDEARSALLVISQMIQLQNVAILPAEQNALEEAMTAVASLPSELRSLTAFHETLQDRRGQMRAAIRNYLRTSSIVGSTFDTEVDTFRSSRFNVVDLGRVANLDAKYLLPFYSTLFWKARSQVSMLREDRAAKGLIGGVNWHFSIDEAHTLTKHPFGRSFIVDMWKMGRKEKFSLGLWSNAAVDFTGNGDLSDPTSLINDLEEAVRTRILFKNTGVATDPDLFKLYAERLKTPPRAMERLPKLAPRGVLWVQPNTGEVWELDTALDDLWLAIVGRTDAADNDRVDAFIEKYGSRWKEELLRYEKINPKHIDRFIEMLHEHDALESQVA